jgi:WD40 repeat protein
VPWLIDGYSGEVERGPDDTSHFAFAPDGLLFAYDSGSRGVLTVDAATGDMNETGLEFGEPEEDDCYGLACSSAGLVAAGGDHGRLRIGDPEAGRWLHVIDGAGGMVSQLAFSPDGQTLATSGWAGAVTFWDVSAGRESGRLALPVGGVAALAFAADGETLAVGDDHGVVRLWPWRRLLAAGGRS